MANIIELTQALYEGEVKQKKELVMIDFYAPWCYPCQVLYPFIEKVSDYYGDRLPIYKVDIDNYPEIAEEHGIRGYPTLLLLREGTVVDSISGKPNNPLVALREFIDKHLPPQE